MDALPLFSLIFRSGIKKFPQREEACGNRCREGITMNGNEVLRIVDAIHRDKNIDKEIVFEGIEQAILSAAKKHYGEDIPLEIQINRGNGNPTLLKEGLALDSDQLGEILGRISAQTAKQVMIQKIREA